MANDFKQPTVRKAEEKFVTERELREIVAAMLANYTGVTRFRTLQTSIVEISDFTTSQHDHSNATGGGQILDTALSAAVTVPKGGTGQTSLTNNAVVVGQGAGAVATITGKSGTGSFYVAATSGASPTVRVDYDRGIITNIV